MDETKTVCVGLDLYTQQLADVQGMRDQLLNFNKKDPSSARKAIQNVTLLRVYHQIERIVRYTEMIDKLEDRIYQSIDMKLANSDPDDDNLWFTLIPIQERLQKMMIESHQLLKPYLDMEQLATLEVQPIDNPTNSFATMILDQEAREKVRTGAQGLLAAIAELDAAQPSEEVKNKAAEALTALEDKPEEDSGEEDRK